MSSVRPTYDSIECHSCLVHLFVYDGDGKRVKKTDGGQTVLYVNKYY